MHSIATIPGTTTAALPAAPVSPAGAAAAPGTGGGDLLAAMNPAMDAAFAVGRPTNAGGAAAILATTGAYVAGANATIDKLGEGIRRREHELDQLRLSNPDAAAKKEQELDMLRALRDRIQLSIERVTRTAAGGDGEDDTVAADAQVRDLEHQRRRLFERRTEATPDVAQVARTYARSGTA